MAWLKIASKTARDPETRLVATLMPRRQASESVRLEQSVACRPRRLPCRINPVRVVRPGAPHTEIGDLTALRTGTGSGEGKAASPPISRLGRARPRRRDGGSLPVSHSRKLVFDWLRHRLQSGGHGIRRLCAVFRDLADIVTRFGDSSSAVRDLGHRDRPFGGILFGGRSTRLQLPAVDTATINLAAE